MLIIYLLIILLLTLIIEIPVAWFLGVKKKKQIMSVVLVNVVTNPAINYCLIINNRLGPIIKNNIAIAILEILVVLIEGLLLSYIWPQKSKAHWFMISLTINLVSFCFSFILF